MRGHDLFRGATLLAVFLCYTTILLGGNVAASNSGLACPDWPSCHGSFLPPFSGGIAVEWSHRLSAFVLTIAVVLLAAFALAFERVRPVLRRLSAAAAALVVGQAVLGGLVVESGLVPAAVVAHLALATMLFGILLVLALAANLKEIPPHWIDWFRRASEARPRETDGPAEDARQGEPEPVASSGA